MTGDHAPGAPGPTEPRGATLAFLEPGARAREDRHRRVLLLGIGSLLLLSLTPVAGRHLFDIAHQPLTGIDHIGALCLVALHVLLAPVHAGLHLLLVLGLAYAIWDRVRVWRRARRVLAPLGGNAPPPNDAFWIAAGVADLSPSRLRIVDGLPTPAFTAGWLRPVVYVARGLAHGPSRLSPGELVAVLAHERAHVERRDPLRFTLLRGMARTLFWIPALRDLADDVADDAEIRADDRATAVSDPLTLASALVSLAAWPVPRTTPCNDSGHHDYGVGFLRADLLDRRVRRLAGENTVPVSRVTRRSLWGAGLALAVVWAAGIVDVHALPHDIVPSAALASADTLHCHHLEGSAVAHLFCRSSVSGAWITPGGIDCPHRSGLASRGEPSVTAGDGARGR